MLCLQYELLNVSANKMNGKSTLDTDGKNRVSHQCELSYEFSEWQMILCICYNGSIGRCWNLLQALRLVGHQLHLLVCLYINN